MTESSESDLPLSANYNEVKVRHCVLKLQCSFAQKSFFGSILLFCEFVKPIRPTTVSKTKRCILDCNSLDIDAVYAHILSRENCDELNKTFLSMDCSKINISETDMNVFNKYQESCSQYSSDMKLKKELDFKVNKHNVDISLSSCLGSTLLIGNSDNEVDQVAVIEMLYRTTPNGPSLKWTVDQCGRSCVFTIGHQLNNRTLFPSQDMPQAMMTWHCSVTLDGTCTDDCVVVMTGEGNPSVSIVADGRKMYGYQSSFFMPASTFALAVGCWEEHIICGGWAQSQLPRVPCHLWAPPSLSSSSKISPPSSLLSWYLPRCLDAVTSLLGPYPLGRLDVLVVPKCFDSLGMACPSLMLLSQSVLCEDMSMLVRVSHELCHTWLGIMTGPSDWTEEWLTEGVCCYLEDVLHGRVMGWNTQECQERHQLRTFLKYKLLKGEVTNTPEDLQTLRPNKGAAVGEEGDTKVKNGLNSEKTFMQVHYLKGFFLLKYLEQKAGQKDMLDAIKNFLGGHLGCLFSSKEFLEHIFEHCTTLRTQDMTVDKLCKEWLDTPDLHKSLVQYESFPQGRLAKEVTDAINTVRLFNSRKRKNREQRETSTLDPLKLCSEQLLLLFESLLEEDLPLTSSCMESLWGSCGMEGASSEVLHAWCELVIRHRARRYFHVIETVLLEHQALGVYLYGEMMITQHAPLQALAKHCFSQVEGCMVEAQVKIVREMLGIEVL